MPVGLLSGTAKLEPGCGKPWIYVVLRVYPVYLRSGRPIPATLWAPSILKTNIYLLLSAARYILTD